MTNHKIASFSIPFLIWLFLLPFLFSLSSCKKESFATSGALSFSSDTISFDTVFTTLGSTTQFFTIRNKGKQAIRISDIHLAGGTASAYRMNVDGDSGRVFRDVEIPAHDSIYVFVEVTVDPTAANLPFLIMDSIQFTTNGIQQQVILQAYGQNAHFFNADSLETNTTWNNDLPYVILNYLQVKPGVSLTINQGCTVYFGGGAAMIVEGDLQVKGTDTSDMVTFRGVRLDQDIAGRSYDDFPGQYAGVFFLRGSTGSLEFLNMRNSSYGINVGNIKTTGNNDADIATLKSMSSIDAPQVTIRNSKIYNNAFYGIFGFLGNIVGENVLVYACGKNVIGFYDGGNYRFTNCTFYDRGTAYISHTKDPLLYLSNYFKYSATDNPIYADTAIAVFTNCILYGSLDEEIVGDEAVANPAKVHLSFDHCVLKTKNALSAPVFNTCLGDDPQFKDVFSNNFKLKATSPCIDFSTPPFPPADIDGLPRTGASADCGAYEYQ